MPIELYPHLYRTAYYLHKGMRNKEIAAAMGLAVGTVKFYILKIKKASGLSERVLIALAFERGEIIEKTTVTHILKRTA